jgi:glycosyltransferase involved in cell wall biosynthesis
MGGAYRNMKDKILYLYHAGDSIGGQATSFSRLYPYLKDYFDFTMLCNNRGKGLDLLLKNGINAKHCNLPIFGHTTQSRITIFSLITLLKIPFNMFWGSLCFLSELLKVKPDIVFIGSTSLLLASVISKFFGYKNIVFACEIVDDGCFGFRKFVATRSISFFSDRILCVSEAAKQKFPPSKKLFLHLDAIDTTEIFDPSIYDKQGLKKLLKIPENAKVVGIFGGIQYAKGHDIFARACVLVVKYFPEYLFLMVGSSPNENKHKQLLFRLFGKKTITDELKSIIKSNHLENNLLFFGQHENVAEIYSVCDLVCMPSYEEAFGDPVIEAGAMGIPVIAYAKGGPLDSVVDGETGILLKELNERTLSEAIIYLLNDEELRLKLGNNSRSHVKQNFSYDVYIPRFINLLTNI